MRISKKKLKQFTRRPRIRPRIVKSLTSFDENINDDQNAKLTAKTQTSDTLGVLNYLIKKMRNNRSFDLNKRIVAKQFMFNQPSVNFNFAALDQLKLVQIDWRSFKLAGRIKGTVNSKAIF